MQNVIGMTLIALLSAAGIVSAEEGFVDISMHPRGASSFYVSGAIPGTAAADFMVDTGSSYMTINEQTLAVLQAVGGVEYRREIVGVLASGEERRVALYRVPRMLLGGRCMLTDVEVAVFPGKTRQILGLNVLRRASPFQFSVDPPSLRLSNCSRRLSQR